MIFRYDAETDMLYVELKNVPSVESDEIAPGIVFDFDATGQVIGIEIEDASKNVDLSKLEITALPFADLIVSSGHVHADRH
ncbi:DUF2283 domain-containing protein [Candidatus Acetothermia bacterium]|jgi:uncharacterized protein YuzE|nr:DUF2283 domain-containing protein [Candidatus Acetothermia bacterium]MCI2431912.1 DUF2283 domain-containing protein [Candidatus Acetothermia bacterium]MCI2437355.1 DUF2283 domain-containing protein [Candidatus Acetothermia bacterium]